MDIKYDNLKSMYDYILLNVPEEEFNICHYTNKPIVEISYTEKLLKENLCGTNGCIIGHCVKLDWDNVIKRFLSYCYNKNTKEVSIRYEQWSWEFTGVERGPVWHFLFGSAWENIGVTSTKSHALARMKFLIETQDLIFCENYMQDFFLMKKGERFIETIRPEFFIEELYN